MSDSFNIQQYLYFLVERDEELCLDQRKLLALLIEKFGERSPYIVALHACSTFGIAKEIAAQKGMPLNEMRKERFVRRLFEARGLNVELIHWSLETWAKAYHCPIDEYKQTVNGTGPVQSKNKRVLPIRKPLQDPIHIKNHRKELVMMRFSPDGKWLASCSFDRTVRIWDAQKGLQKAVLYGGHRERVRGLAYRPDGQQLISVGDDFAARIWDMRTGKKGLRLLGHTAPVIRAEFTANGDFLILLSLDKTLTIWRVESAEMVMRMGPFTEQPHGFSLYPNGKLLAISLRNRIEVWDISTNDRSATFPSKGEDCQILASDRGLFIGDERGLRLIDSQSGTHQLQFKGHYQGITSLAIDPDCISLVSAGMDQTLRVWDLDTAKLSWTFELRRKVTSIDINFAGTLAVTFGEDFGLLFPMGRGV